MKKTYAHLDQFKRDRLQALWDEGFKKAVIARIVGVDKSTMTREIQRNRKKIRAKGGTRDGPYFASLAQHKAYVRRKYAKYQGKHINEHDALKDYITGKLKRSWSPDAIAGSMKKRQLPFYASKTAIYQWLYSNRGQYWCGYLYSQRYHPKKRKGKKTKKNLIPYRKGLVLRPLGATNKTRYGHYEGDTIVSGKKTASRAALSVLYERKTKYVGIRKIDTVSPILHNEAIKRMTRTLATPKSITFDNGIENTKHYELGIPTFFCDPYSSWQKGGVENINKQLRQFIPKGSDIAQYSSSYLTRAERILNHKPRKSLGYATPYEVMFYHHLLNPIKNTRVALRG
ncbi:MAG: IS30 family transposase [Candidatus Colwellbacteria bacterium]|nr:IS30 family transposase [Candidatus Colwellbacteria bacterium]